MDNLEDYVQDEGLELLISQTSYDIDLDEHLLPACGQTAELAAIFDNNRHQQNRLLADEIEVFTTCITGVFSFADNQLPFEGYGFLKRFDDLYVERVAKLAYLCGYRTDVSLSNLALATWIQPISDVRGSDRFRCYGDRYSWGSGSPQGNFLAGADIVMDNLGPYSVFHDWKIAQRYIAYRNIVQTNRQRLICEDDIEIPLSNDFSYDDKVELLREGDCF
ncbi:MAG: hypothetical protein AAGA08_01810 [Pseudomonadota bacterium]